MVGEGLIGKEEAVMRVDRSSLTSFCIPCSRTLQEEPEEARDRAAGFAGRRRGKVVFTADDAVEWRRSLR